MGRIIAGDASLTITDERAFAHIRAAVISLVVDRERSFFLEAMTPLGRVATLCGPNLPLQFESEADLVEDDNDTWVAAIEEATIATGVLTLMREESAEGFLQRSLDANRHTQPSE
jgi:hypothetical protein